MFSLTILIVYEAGKLIGQCAAWLEQHEREENSKETVLLWDTLDILGMFGFDREGAGVHA